VQRRLFFPKMKLMISIHRHFLFVCCTLSIFTCGGAAIADDSASSAPANLEVGTFCAPAPYGITMLVNRGAAFVINPIWDAPDTRFEHKDPAAAGYGACAPDGSYYKATFPVGGANVTFTWGKLDDHSVGATLTTDKPTLLQLQMTQPFSGCKTYYWPAADGVDGCGWAGNTAAYTPIHIHTQPPPQNVAAQDNSTATISSQLDPSHPTVLVASISDLPSFDSVVPALAKAGQVYENHRVTASGDWGDFLEAITNTMNCSRFFSSIDRSVAHAVGRGWWIGQQPPSDEAPLFGWDSNFNGDLASLEDPAAARDTVRAVFSLQTPDGMIANYSHWPAGDKWVSVERTDPPVAALCVWKMYQRWPDKKFLAEIYPKLLKWHDWWHVKRARPGEFLLSWGSNKADMGGKGDMADAGFETGWDDTASMSGAHIVGTCANIYPVDLNSLWATDAENLAKIADVIGNEADAERLRGEHDRMVKEMNNRLWNESLGLYCSRFWDDNPDGTPHFQPLITPMNFYPLICGAPDKARAARMLDYFHRPTKFWGPYPVPTLAYDDPNWKKQEYWHGHVWAPVNYLLWQGLVQYDDDAHLADYVEKSVKLFMHGWNDKGICSENYRSDNGEPDDDPHYTWGALLPLIGVEALVDIGPDLKPVPRQTALTENLTLRRIPIGGVLYRIDCQAGKVSASPE
jgi:glycogen debranching enzyme